MSSLPEDIDREIQADLQRGIDSLRASVQSAMDAVQAEISYSIPSLSVRKMAMVVPISNELLHPEDYPSPHVSRLARFRWWRRDLVYRARGRLGELVAGRKFYQSSDYD